MDYVHRMVSDKNTTFRKLDLLRPQVKERMYIPSCSFIRADLNHWSQFLKIRVVFRIPNVDQLHKSSNSNCIRPSSHHSATAFTIACRMWYTQFSFKQIKKSSLAVYKRNELKCTIKELFTFSKRFYKLLLLQRHLWVRKPSAKIVKSLCMTKRTLLTLDFKFYFSMRVGVRPRNVILM